MSKKLTTEQALTRIKSYAKNYEQMAETCSNVRQLGMGLSLLQLIYGINIPDKDYVLIQTMMDCPRPEISKDYLDGFNDAMDVCILLQQQTAVAGWITTLINNSEGTEEEIEAAKKESLEVVERFVSTNTQQRESCGKN